jgi:hypothetical protein
MLFRPTSLSYSAVMSSRGGLQTVSFEPIRESWNEYIFSDSVTVRLRLILTTIVQKYDFGPLTFETQNVTVVSAPESLRGSPGNSEQGLDQDGPRWECPILIREEKWNEYSISNGDHFVKIIFIANRAFKIGNAFDKFGQPVYFIEGKPLVKVFDK